MQLLPLSFSTNANQCFSIKVNGALLITWSQNHYVQFIGSSNFIILYNKKSFTSASFIKYKGPIQFQVIIFVLVPPSQKKISFCYVLLEGAAMTKWLNKTFRFTKPAMQLISQHLRQCYFWNSNFEISPPRESVLRTKVGLYKSA